MGERERRRREERKRQMEEIYDFFCPELEAVKILSASYQVKLLLLQSSYKRRVRPSFTGPNSPVLQTIIPEVSSKPRHTSLLHTSMLFYCLSTELNRANQVGLKASLTLDTE